MSSIADLATLLSRMNAPTQVFDLAKSSQWATGNNINSTWLDVGVPSAGAAPGAAAIPTSATTGSLGQGNASGASSQRCWIDRAQLASGAVLAGWFLLVDRLAHMSGLDGTVTTAQNVNTPALTRATSGVNVWAAAEVYTSIGTSGSTLTMSSYTNSAGTAARSGQAIAFGVASNSNLRVLTPLSMQSGDKGLKSVEQVTLGTSSGTAGNFGISLFKTLAMWPNLSQIPAPLTAKPLPMFGALPIVEDNACLMILHGSGGQATIQLMATINFFED